MNCLDCKNELTDPKTAWLEYRGWATPKPMRGDGTGSSLVGRETTGRALCHSCATKRLHLGSPIEGQTSLIAGTG